MTTYLYGDRGSAQAVAAWREAEVSGPAVDQAILPHPAPRPVRPRLHDNLSTGDVLVVDNLSVFGETYEEIVDAVCELMRRKVMLRSVEDNLLFDVLAETTPEKSSRNAHITDLVATTLDRKSAIGAAQMRAALLVEHPAEQWRERAGSLQFRVIAGQIAAFAAIIYLLGIIAPGSHRRENPIAPSDTFQARPNGASIPPPTDDETRDTRHLLARAASYTAATTAPGQKRSNAIGLSAQQQQLAYDMVANWRSARAGSRSFDGGIGATVPRRVRLVQFPDRLIAQASNLREYRFVVQDQRVVVVDPGTRRIVAVLTE